jgi:alpha-D-xyloside xylohydrolase
MFRSLVFDWPNGPALRSITDQYLFGDAFLVCPGLDASGTRSVYLPEGTWLDFWSGQALNGPLHLHAVHSPLQRMPLFVRRGSTLSFAEPAQTTRSLAGARRLLVRFDKSYRGFDACGLKGWIRL